MNSPRFQDQFAAVFHANQQRLYRFLDRVSGDPELAADLTQEALVKLYQRGSLPERPSAWLVTVALNLFRNNRSGSARRSRLLSVVRSEGALSDPRPTPQEENEANELRRRVRAAVDRLSERERNLLLLRAEGYSYHDLAAALGLNEASIGTLLARAKQAFREIYESV